MGRSLNDLRRDQEAILNAHRAEQSAVVAEARSAEMAAGCGYAFGRVDEIVVEDETYGPHVLVVRQTWSGTPPVPADANVGPSRAHPVPGLVVTDFAVGDTVRMSFVSGAVLVERLG